MFFPYCLDEGVDCERIRGEEQDIFIVIKGYRHFCFKLNPLGLRMDNKQLIGVLENTEILQHVEELRFKRTHIPIIRKATAEEITYSRLHNYGFKVLIESFDPKSWHGIVGERHVQWCYDEEQGVKGFGVHDEPAFMERMSFVYSELGQLHPIEKFLTGQWNGKYWIIKPRCRLGPIIMGQLPTTEESYDNDEMFRYLEQCFTLWEDSSPRTATTYWPQIIITTKVRPVLKPATFNLTIVHAREGKPITMENRMKCLTR